MSAPSAAWGEASGSVKRSFGALVEILNPGTLNACNLNAFSVQAEGSRAWRRQRSLFTRSPNAYPRRSAIGPRTGCPTRRCGQSRPVANTGRRRRSLPGERGHTCSSSTPDCSRDGSGQPGYASRKRSSPNTLPAATSCFTSEPEVGRLIWTG